MSVPFVPQGTLNRLRCSIVVPEFPVLNITASYMGKSFAKVSFDGKFNDLIATATGGVTSPEPYVMTTLTVGVLRSQALAAAWLVQAQLLGTLGPITVYPDTSVYPSITLLNSVIGTIDPGAYDGMDPVVRLTLQGIYPINAALWSTL